MCEEVWTNCLLVTEKVLNVKHGEIVSKVRFLLNFGDEVSHYLNDGSAQGVGTVVGNLTSILRLPVYRDGKISKLHCRRPSYESRIRKSETPDIEEMRDVDLYNTTRSHTVRVIVLLMYCLAVRRLSLSC